MFFIGAKRISWQKHVKQQLWNNKLFYFSALVGQNERAV